MEDLQAVHNKLSLPSNCAGFFRVKVQMQVPRCQAGQSGDWELYPNADSAQVVKPDALIAGGGELLYVTVTGPARAR